MRRAYRLGLTGSIGMGKSTTAKMFAQQGCAVWDADAAVHRLYAVGGAAVPLIGELCPEAIQDGAVSREALKGWIGQDPGALAKIEKVVHPLVAADRSRFADLITTDIAVFDIPLLFEGGAERDLDAVAVVTAPPEVQLARVLERPGMTEHHFRRLLAKQMPDAEKKLRADHIIPTTDLETAQTKVAQIVNEIREHHA